MAAGAMFIRGSASMRLSFGHTRVLPQPYSRHGSEHEASGEADPLYGYPHIDFKLDSKRPKDALADAVGIIINGDVEVAEKFEVR